MEVNIPDSSLPRVVIVGSGFGGIQLAKSLTGKAFEVVLLDKNNYHTFLPLLYQVATAGLEPDAIAEPVREIFNGQPRFNFRMAEVLQIDPQQNTLTTSIGTLHYDYLVLACGSQANFYRNEELIRHALPMKTVRNALALRSRLLENSERALELSDKQQQLEQVNIVIAGGGPTGVELAGAIAELRDVVLAKDYPELPLKHMKIHLVEGNDRLLKSMGEDSSWKARQFLTRMGITVHLNALVKSYDGAVVTLSNGDTHAARTLFWTAGVEGVLIPGLSPASVGKGSRYVVNVFNQVEGYENVFAIGDNALQVFPDYPQGLPGLAPTSIQQGQWLAKNLVSLHQKQPLQPFRYVNKGVMAVIGRNRAVVELPFWHTQGFIAWLLWMGVHLLLLVGFRNKASTVLNWAVNYFSYSRASRLITRFQNAPVEAVTSVSGASVPL
ncbi:NAD(P)/FAD-dependent oxidoreductase [Spirosoma pollinicola]|uniref:NADH:ubiquinone reductase (non-electrogenic) n=1 Tax=Spirosoma pollinicola TaxID=2057025 RepID=A0A2K8YU26_9BACT|nr:NAD(P)/FAD-dependent oxidoreductase [Spirosoma pollinicola]AUD01142.1 FAD-dependent oxidoreductase [Spirosoma pollinicola]